jgi:hypothetical protein
LDADAIHKNDTEGKNALIHGLNFWNKASIIRLKLLSKASANGHTNVVELIYKQAKLDHKDVNGKTAVFYGKTL